MSFLPSIFSSPYLSLLSFFYYPYIHLFLYLSIYIELVNSSYVYNRHEWGGNKSIKATYQGLKSLGDMRNKSNVNSTVTISSKPMYSKNSALRGLYHLMGEKHTYLFPTPHLMMWFLVACCLPERVFTTWKVVNVT